MIWYSKKITVNDIDILVEGTLIDSVVQITANGYKLYDKPINMWAYQEVYAQDVLDKFKGTLKKCEYKIPLLVDAGKIV